MNQFLHFLLLIELDIVMTIGICLLISINNFGKKELKFWVQKKGVVEAGAGVVVVVQAEV